MKIPGSKRLVLNDFLCCDLLQYLPAHQLQYAAMNLYSIKAEVFKMMLDETTSRLLQKEDEVEVLLQNLGERQN